VQNANLLLSNNVTSLLNQHYSKMVRSHAKFAFFIVILWRRQCACNWWTLTAINKRNLPIFTYVLIYVVNVFSELKDTPSTSERAQFNSCVVFFADSYNVHGPDAVDNRCRLHCDIYWRSRLGDRCTYNSVILSLIWYATFNLHPARFKTPPLYLSRNDVVCLNHLGTRGRHHRLQLQQPPGQS